MRKSQFKLQAERGTEKRGYNQISVLYFYKASQYRWDDSQTADPQYDDVTYHLTEKAAIEAADAINLDLGFEAIVERIYVEYSDFNEGVEFRQEFELKDLDDYKYFDSVERDRIYTGKFNNGGDLPEDGVIVSYRHHMYMGYAYTITQVLYVSDTDFKTLSDLRNDKESTFSTYYFLAKDIDELAIAFADGSYPPFNKLNKGRRIVSEFLKEQKHPDYID